MASKSKNTASIWLAADLGSEVLDIGWLVAITATHTSKKSGEQWMDDGWMNTQWDGTHGT